MLLLYVMSKPRVFISSTFYDLRHIRLDLDKFIESMGYEPVRNEEGDIPYGKDSDLQEYCYKEISNIDILVSIIGGRYGSESSTKDYSISQKELKTALEEDKHVFIFIQKDVASEFHTYKDNKEVANIRYHYVDDNRIYPFLEEIYALPKNNNIKEFETTYDIIKYLREQWAGLFKKYIDEQQRIKETVVIRDIEGTAKTLKTLVDYLQSVNQDKGEAIELILKTNHPLVSSIKSLLKIPYNFYIEGIKDLNSLLVARNYKRVEKTMVWVSAQKSEKLILTLSDKLFDGNNKLKNMKASEWKDEYCQLQREPIQQVDEDENLPF